MINVNVRNVKRGSEGFSALTKAQAGVVSLCEHCALKSECEPRKKIKRIDAVETKIVTCRYYHWPIVFRDEKGTEQAFNTLRLGPAWFNRVEEGDRVGLLNKEGIVFGFARVTDKFLLDKQIAVDKHAHLNHLMLGAAKGQVSDQMLKILRNSYGNLVFKNNDRISVVYLQRDV